MAKSNTKTAREIFHKSERRRNLILLMREHPDWSHSELAKELGVERGTVTRDLSEITRDMQKMNTEAFQVHWQRLLMEITANKTLCMNMLKDAQKKKSGSGSRWMEEMSKIMMLEMKLLGLDKFDPNVIKERKPFDKAQRDAAIEAAVKGFEIGLDTAKTLVNKADSDTPPASRPPEQIGEPLNQEAI